MLYYSHDQARRQIQENNEIHIHQEKLQPFIAIMSSALIIGLVAGMPFDMITDTLAEGVGTTLQTIAILIGLGSMFGAILQVSGGVEVIADTLLRIFGEKKAPWALGITGLIVGMPVFFESGLLILIPVAFVPPTPGPVLVAEMLNVELSYVIILLPLFLIILNTLSSVIPFMKPAQPLLEFLGTPIIALLLSTICAMVFLGIPAGFGIKEITNVMTNSLHSCGNIILLISGGGMLRFVLQNSGIGELFGNFVGGLPLPMVLVAFLVAAAVRVSVGSATVSMTMAAGIIASMPMVASLSQIQLATLTIAIAAGGIAFSHVNDSGFWLSKSLFEVDEKTNLKTWTVMETIVGLVGIAGATGGWFVVS